MNEVLVLSLKFCIVDLVIEMVKKRKVKDMDIKIKYTCLAITVSILLSTSHLWRINPGHVELICDIVEFNHG